MIDAFKEFAPILTGITGLLVAFLSGFFFKKNKQTEYSMKLAEEAIEKIYNPILIEIEQNPRHFDGYDGLDFEEIEDIKKRFFKHRHLVDEKLLSMIWQFEEEYRYVQEYYFLSKQYASTDNVNNFEEHKFDQKREFFDHLIFVRKKHLKNLGFSTKIKPSIYEKLNNKLLSPLYESILRRKRFRQIRKRNKND